MSSTKTYMYSLNGLIMRSARYRHRELLGKAKDLLQNDLNEKVVAVLLGHNVKGLAAQLGAYGADKVIVVDDKRT